MTASLDAALRTALCAPVPRHEFADGLLVALRQASLAPVSVMDTPAGDAHGRWVFAGTLAGAVGAGVAVFGVRRRIRRGRAA